MTRWVLAVGLSLAPAVVTAAGPVGAITSVDCEAIEGWAYDPDDPTAPIDVHLYFDGPAGDPVAVGVPVTADALLEVGCVGMECEHGFRLEVPLSRLDGVGHAIHAYGIDAVDPNLELSSSPGTLQCPARPLQSGRKRHVAAPPVLQAWAWSTFFDLMPVADVDLAALALGPTIDAAPVLVADPQAESEVWLLDQGVRRPVDEVAMAAWRFDVTTVSAMSADELAEIPLGTALPARPILVQGSGAEVYLVDDHQCVVDDPDPVCAPEPEDEGDTGDTGDEPDAGSDGTGGEETGELAEETTGDALPADDLAGDDEAAGCGCATTPVSPRGLAWMCLLVIAAPRRRC